MPVVSSSESPLLAMNFLFVCLSSAVAALAMPFEALPAGADVAVLFDRRLNLNEGGDHQLQGDPRRLSGKGDPDTCNTQYTAKGTPDKTVAFSETTLQALFTCGANFNHAVIPDCAAHSTQCCQDTAGTNDNAEIADVLGVKGKAVKSGQTVTVTLEKIPDDKRGQSIYYKCTKSNQSEFCLVALALPSAIGPNDCAIDKVVTISIGKTAPSANFKCAGGSMDLKPFEVTDGKCSANRKTTTAAQVTGVTREAGEFKVTVDQLPSQTEQLCYTCSYANVPEVEENSKKTTRTCSVIVAVEAAASTTSTVTTTSSARSILMTSGAMSVLIAMVLTVGTFN
ncbi:sag-related sequence srs53c [Cystoisospora suis]|uniref:Sag-related sequence srs53c n=1 Tax=Cystoisospora suis TaxID=483139 RepID=A0A2C6LDS2_9APIC|nr:sag-related sequence srs53c [Cystoisospora suis]